MVIVILKTLIYMYIFFFFIIFFASIFIAGRHSMEMYHRCFYCVAQESKARFLLRWSLEDGISEDIEMFQGEIKGDIHCMFLFLMKAECAPQRLSSVNFDIVEQLSAWTTKINQYSNFSSLRRTLYFVFVWSDIVESTFQ